MTGTDIALWSLGLGLFFGVLCVVGVFVERMFPHDPPPLQDGESIASRLGKLYWE